MDVKKVLCISQEIDPYLSGTPLGLFSRRLAQGLQETGAEVRSFMPKYGAINERRNQLHEVIRLSGLNISIDDTDHPLIIKVATLQPSRLQVYFIDNDDYFFRKEASKVLETVDDTEHNDERSIFFVRGVIETVKKLRWEPDMVHCVGWISYLVPIYLRYIYNEDPAFSSSKVVLSLFNHDVLGGFDSRMAAKLLAEGFDAGMVESITTDGHVDPLKLAMLAIDSADAVVESSEGVDPCILEYAKTCGKPFATLIGEEPDTEAYRTFFASL